MGKILNLEIFINLLKIYKLELPDPIGRLSQTQNISTNFSKIYLHKRDNQSKITFEFKFHANLDLIFSYDLYSIFTNDKVVIKIRNLTEQNGIFSKSRRLIDNILQINP